MGVALVTLVTIAVLASLTAQSRSRLEAARAEMVLTSSRKTALTKRLTEAASAADKTIAITGSQLWVGENSAAIELAFQKSVVGAAEMSGLQLVSFGPAPGPVGFSHAALGYELDAEGGHEELARFLAEIESSEPRFAFSFVWIRQFGGGERQGKGLVTARIGL